jgi:hypothetical protein
MANSAIGEAQDLRCRSVHVRAQISLAGPAGFPTATSGARNPGGVPRTFWGGFDVRNAWSRSIKQTSSQMISSPQAIKSRYPTI